MGIEALESNKTVLFAYIDMVLSLKGMTYRNMADATGINVNTFYAMKAGSQRVDVDRLYMMFDALGVSYGDYLEYVQYIKDSGTHSLITL